MKRYILLFLFVLAFSVAGQMQTFAQGSKTLKEFTSADITIYPNPTANGEFKVKGDYITEIEVLNLIGRSIIHNKLESPSQDEVTIKIDKPEKGYYLVKVTFRDNKTVVKKVLLK